MAFIKVLNMSITAGWMILAVVLLRPLLKRSPKWIRYILWSLVAIRLLVPISFESVTSLVPSTETIPEMTVYYDSSQIPYIHSGSDVVNSTVNPIISDRYIPLVDDTVPVEGTVNPATDLIFIISTVWLIGVAMMLVYCIISYALLRRKVRVSVPAHKNIRICDSIDSPFILGIIRPTIYIPSNMTDSQHSSVIAHEQMHIQHGDHLWKVLGFIILSVYWWNPLIWVAYVLFCRDIELICDEAVVKKMESADRVAYSEALLSFNMPKRIISACPLAFGEVGVKARIKSVLNYKKPGLWIIIAAILICTVTAVCLLTDPIKKDDPFEYDRIQIETFDGNQGSEDHSLILSVKEGASYILPGYGDIDKIVCKVDMINGEKKTVRLKLDHPLKRLDVNEETDTVMLLLDHLVTNGIGNDKVTLAAPDHETTYVFSHALVKGAPLPEAEEKELTISDLISEGLLRDPKEYKEHDVTARLFGYVNPDGRNYPNSNNDKAYNLYDVLKVEYFTPIDPTDVPETDPIRIVFTDKSGMKDEYAVYDDDIVIYKMGDGEPLYFKAASGVFNSIRIREEKDNNVYKGDGSVTLPVGDPVKEANTFRVGNSRYTLDYSKTAACYVLEEYTMGNFSSAVYHRLDLLPSYPIQTNLKNYTISVDKTDEDNPKLIAEYDGKKVSYSVKYDNDAKKPVLTNPEGNTDFQLFVPTRASGLISTPDYGSGETMETVSITGADVSGACSFSIVVNSSKLGSYRATYIPKEVYNVYATTDKDGNVQIIAEKGDKLYKMGVEIINDKLVLTDPPADFGEAYVYANSKIPDDAIIFEYADLDGVAPSAFDKIYITEGPIFSGGYSFDITVRGNVTEFTSTFTYDKECTLEFIKPATHLLQLKMTDNNGNVSIYDVKLNTGTFDVNLNISEGEKILKQIYAVNDSEKHKLSYLYSSVSADIDGDGIEETVTLGPGVYSGLSSFSLKIQYDTKTFGPVSFVSDSISQSLVLGDDGKLRLRAEYEDEVIYYDILPESGEILAEKSGVGVK